MAWVIDPSHTQIEFSVKHMMITTVRGRFAQFAGTLNIDENDLGKSTVEGTVDVASIDTREANRDAHLRSADFFDADNYPQLHFRLTGIEPAGEGNYKVAGELTIRETTHPVIFDVTDEGQNLDPWGDLRWGLSARTSINRKDYGLNWNVALERGGWLVGEQVKIEITLQLKQVQPQTEQSESTETMAA